MGRGGRRVVEGATAPGRTLESGPDDVLDDRGTYSAQFLAEVGDEGEMAMRSARLAVLAGAGPGFQPMPVTQCRSSSSASLASSSTTGSMVS